MLFVTASVPFYIPTCSAQGFQYLSILTNTSLYCGGFLVIAILMDVRCFLIAVLVCISLMITGVELLFICFLAFVLTFFRLVIFIILFVFLYQFRCYTSCLYSFSDYARNYNRNPGAWGLLKYPQHLTMCDAHRHQIHSTVTEQILILRPGLSLLRLQ